MEDGVGNDPAAGGQREDGPGEVSRRETSDGSATLFSSRFDQTFHSHHGAVAEARHVFLEGSGIGAKLRNGEAARVLEVGFGTGLNFLLTAQRASEAGTRLYYVALERELLPAPVLASLGYHRFAPTPLAALLEFRARLPERPQPGDYLLDIAGTHLDLRLGEAVRVELEASTFDAVYHDAFSPDANPELWTPEFLTRLSSALAPDGVLVSYTVKGEVRRVLRDAGLLVTKEPGPTGGKREMLRAQRSGA